MADYTFRIHPAIGIARVGTSPDYYLAPETAAALPAGPGPQTGGLPIKAGTESTTITDQDIRDAQGRLVKQAARFRIYQYPAGAQTYPTGQGTEVTVGTQVNGKTVKDIIWTVHLANKKANCYVLPEPDQKGQEIIDFYQNCQTPPLRNTLSEIEQTLQDDGATDPACETILKGFSNDPDDPTRRTQLQIDPGPRAIRASDRGAVVNFDNNTVASYWESGDQVSQNPNYPQSFPPMHFPNLYSPQEPITTLGSLTTESNGRLIVIPASGTACAFTENCGLYDDVNNDCWFDDVGDGPVWATLVFDDGSTQQAQGAWVVTTDPGYAPQTLNVVSLWDDIYNTFVEDLDLDPSLYNNGAYVPTFKPSFDDNVHPIFRAAAMQMWNTNLPKAAMAGHRTVDGITASDTPSQYLNVKSIIRDPNNWQTESEEGAPKMPLSLGDSGMSFLMVSTTQYFFLSQWFANIYSQEPGPALGPGEYLDKVTLVNCLGGRFSPGIDMTFIIRQPGLWKADWPQEGPFRINGQILDYGSATKETPFLTAGWFPLRTDQCPPYSQGVEPGDTSKFMALPWHTDYNSCATHPPSPNPKDNLTLYWSWPAQRPVAVYLASEVQDGELPQQRFSVRGRGTATTQSAEVGRYQERIDIVLNWHKIGMVIQATAIQGENLPAEYYLEVQSQLDNSGNAVIPWPNTIRDATMPASEATMESAAASSADVAASPDT